MASNINSKQITPETSEDMDGYELAKERKLETSYNPSEDVSLTFNPSESNIDVKEQSLSICNNDPKLLHKVKRRRPELEDGEVPDDMQCSEESVPICRFFVRNACTWGSSCRFRHPGTVDMGNYVMFEPLDLPKPKYAGIDNRNYKKHSAQPVWTDIPNATNNELENSFNTSLQNLKNLMRNAGYAMNPSNNTGSYRADHNDMDKDPSYSNRYDHAREPSKERSNFENPLKQGVAHSPSPYDMAKPWQRKSSQLRADQFYCGDSDSSTSTDYSSTTCSSSSGPPINCCKRKKLAKPDEFEKRMKMSSSPLKTSSNSCVQKAKRLPRRSRLQSRYERPSTSDSSSYGSSTHTELSSSPMEHRRIDKKSMHKDRPKSKNKPTTSIDQSQLKNREYLLKKLKEVEMKIARKEKKIKLMNSQP